MDADAKLMLRVQDGDLAAFDELVGRHQRTVLNVAYRYVGDRGDAEDATQEVFLRVFRARSRYEPSARFSTWLYRIAVNYCLNAIKRERPQVGVAEPAGEHVADPAEQPGLRLERKELAEAVRAAVDRLPDQQRMALILNRFDGLDYRTISESMGISVMAVKSLLMRARVGLRDHLARLIGDWNDEVHRRSRPAGDEPVFDSKPVFDGKNDKQGDT